MLREYKAQQRVEGGFRFLKSPEFLSDAFYVKKPERIEALLMIMTLSLLVYAALEYRARNVLKTTDPFFPDLKGKKSTRTPTARWMPKNVTLHFEDAVYEMIKTAADGHHRNLSSFIEFATLQYLSSKSYVDKMR